MDIYNKQNMNIDINELPKIRNGRIWYVAILPLLGLYLENFAVNLYLGILLWAFIIIACPLVCIWDEKDLSKLGLSNRQLHSVRWFAPLYIFKRSVFTKQSTAPVVMFCIFGLYALMNNGFTTSLRLNDDSFISLVKSTGIASLEEYQESGYDEKIGSQIKIFANENSTEWTVTKENGTRIVTVAGKCNYDGEFDRSFVIEFEVEFDGYAIKKINVGGVKFNGKELDGDERSQLLETVFTAKNDESSQQLEYKSA